MARIWVVVLAAGCGSLVYYDKADDIPRDPVGDPSTDGVARDSGADPGTEPTFSDSGTAVIDTYDYDPYDTIGGSDGGGTTLPTGTGCVYPTTPVLASGPPTFAMYNPWFVGLTFYGVTANGAIHDYDAGAVAYSAIVDFTFFDFYGFPVCDVVYEADTATPAAAAWTTDSGGVLFDRYELVLANGSSTCGAAYGYDLRDVLESFDWGIGFGQLVGLSAYLQYLVANSGQDWATGWAPYTFAIYVEGGLAAPPGTAVEAGYATALDRDCGDVFVDPYGAGTPVAMPTAGPLDHYVNAHPLLIFNWPPL